jgi:hypothetical protein
MVQVDSTQFLALLLLLEAAVVVRELQHQTLLELQVVLVVVEVALLQAVRRLVGQGHLLRDLLVVLEIT